VNRYKTYKSWIGNVDPLLLSKAGFYFLNNRSDSVKCFSCGLQLKDWDITDDPFDEHYKWSPECKFINSVHLPKNVVENNKYVSDNSLPSSLAHFFRSLADKIGAV
jgi:hypothetical protein